MLRIPRHVPCDFLVTHSDTCALVLLVSESEISTIDLFNELQRTLSIELVTWSTTKQPQN